MRIIAIDPGPIKSAWVCLDDIGGFGWQTTTKGHDTNEQVIECLDSFPRSAIMVIEDMQWYGPKMTAGQSTFTTCKWIGRFEEMWKPGVVVEVFATTKKTVVCGLANAKDKHVRQCMIDRWGAPGNKKNRNPVTHGMSKDLWSALAVATWYLDTHKKAS